MEKYAIVTGASSGIGNATAKKLVDSGVKVFGLDINENCNLDIESYICDVSNEKQVIDIMTLVKKKTKRLDYLVNCAGILSIGKPLSIKDMSSIQWNAIMQINLESVLIMIKNCYSFMRDGKTAASPKSSEILM
jgi:3-oxoacyl-[acyl-carrier protein] reductase